MTTRDRGSFRRAIVTGASSGIGAAVARALAAPGARLLLLGRNEARLSAVADGCKAAGAEVDTACLDLRDDARLRATLRAFEDNGAPDLLVANAGVEHFLAPDAAVEDADALLEQLDVNLRSTLLAATLVSPAMAAAGGGAILLVSSLAGLTPQPDQPAYGASKAALLAWGEAAGPRLRARGITLTVACPGFVRTGMAAGFQGPRPFEISAEQAASRALRAVRRGEAAVFYPAVLAWPARLATLLPRAVRSRLMGALFPAGRAPDQAPEP